jgi:predicted nucleic acid-binding protein
MSVIANTTVLSNFACIGELKLLHQLYEAVFISVEVYDEIQTGLEEGYAFYTALNQQIFPASESGWIHLTNMADEEEFRLFIEFPSKLHRGEASSLAIAAHRNWLFLTDDLDARKTARALGVRLSGSLGCLVLAVERKLCTLIDANLLLEQLIQQGYHSPVADLITLL